LHRYLVLRTRVVFTSVKDDARKSEIALQYAHLCLNEKIYPGGICWVHARDENVGSQLVSFSKTQLNLEVPDSLNIEEQVHYCWSHWLQSDVLIILDNVKEYQQIEPFLPPNERRYKIIVTTEYLCQQSWLDKSFELFSVDITQQECEDEQNESEGESELFLLLIGLVFQSISTLSLIASYIWCGSSPWQQKFTPNGWIIEFLRSGILLFELSVIYLIFKKEALELCGFIPSNTRRKSLKLIRQFIVTSVIAFTMLLTYYHLNLAPYNLARSQNGISAIESEQGFKLYKLPYLLYLPYSFINFIVVGGSAISIGLYSSLKDLKELFDYKKMLNKKLAEISTFISTGSGQVLSKNNLCQKIERNFEEFCRNFIDKIGRYTFLFLVFAFGVSYEVLIGRVTLSDIALLWLSIGYLLLATVVGAIFLGYLYYENALKESAKLLFNLHYEAVSTFESRYNTFRFFQRVFQNYISLYLGILLIIVALIFTVLVNLLN
jgi:hypothetical protein